MLQRAVANPGQDIHTDSELLREAFALYLLNTITQETSSGGNTTTIQASETKRSEKYYGILPRARGYHNGFSGEIVDAASYAIPWYLIERYIWPQIEHYSNFNHHSISTAKPQHARKRMPQANCKAIPKEALRAAAVIRSAYFGTGLFASFAALSTLGVDYRTWSADYWPGEEKKLDPQLEKYATRATVLGTAVGSAAAFGISSVPKVQSRLASDSKGITPRVMPLKRLPFSLGIGCVVGFFFDFAGHILYHSRL